MIHIYDDIFNRVVGQRYRVTDRLGAGAFGEVFQAKEEIYDIPLRTVALKLFTNGYVTHNNAKEVFKEALMLVALVEEARRRGETPHLVSVYDMGVLKDYQHLPYIAMEFVDGGSLEKELKRAGRFPLKTVINYLLEIVAGLRMAHEAVPALIHRDLKPGNILLNRNKFLMVADFGVAVDRYEALGQGGGGTVTYAAPELYTGEPVTPAYDVYSLGVMMVEMLLGYNPLDRIFQKMEGRGDAYRSEWERSQGMLAKLQESETGRPLQEIIVEEEGLWRSFQGVLSGCLNLHPKSRFADARALEQALKQCQEEERIDLPLVTAAEMIGHKIRCAERSLRKGDLEKAEELYQEVRRDEPYNTAVCWGLSEIYERRGHLTAAIKEQERGTKSCRTYDGMIRLAALYEKAGRAAEARVAIKTAEQLPRN
jgi:serine/threonine protein kinase